MTIPLLAVRLLRLITALPGRLLAGHLNGERDRNGLGPLSTLQRGAAHVFVWVIALTVVLMVITRTL